MATITSTSGISSVLGTYSGIGSDQIDKLIEAESVGKLRAQSKVSSVESQKTAYSDVRSRLSNLLSKLKDLTNTDTFASKKATSSNEAIATISGGSSSIAGTYDLQVSQLATNTRLVGAKVADNAKTAMNVSGTLSLISNKVYNEGNNRTFDISLDATDTLSDIANKINKKSTDSGISAVVMDGRLVLSNTETGEKSLAVGDNTVSQALGLSTSATNNAAQLNLGKNALFSVNGVSMSSQSNTVSDLVDGVTLTLKQTTAENTTVHLGLTDDVDKTVSAVQSFVDQYNSTYSFIDDSLDVGTPKVSTDDSSSTNKQGALVGDSLMMRLQTQLRSYGSANPTDSTLKVNQIGISIDRNGVMTLDQSKLKKALADNPNAVKEFFNGPEQTTSATSSTSDSATTSSGYAGNMLQLLNGYLEDSVSSSGQTIKGLLKSRTESFDSLIKDLNKQIDRFDDYLTTKRTYYVNMFTKLDAAMMQAEEQMKYFTAQSGNNN